MHFHPKNVQKFAVFYFPGDCGHFFAVQGVKYCSAGKKNPVQGKNIPVQGKKNPWGGILFARKGRKKYFV